MPSLDQNCIFGLDQDVSTSGPNLRCLLTVMSVGEHILARCNVCRDLQLVNDMELQYLMVFALVAIEAREWRRKLWAVATS
jgi:hypothetical protein